jgi:hypothetical protein
MIPTAWACHLSSVCYYTLVSRELQEALDSDPVDLKSKSNLDVQLSKWQLIHGWIIEFSFAGG